MTTQRLDSFNAISRGDWNGLLDQRGWRSPFVSHDFLCGLEATGCTRRETGWQAMPILCNGADGLLGAAPLYLKDHSYGEYVFDWAWADAYARAGRSYYPKLLVASPFSPIPGPRLLAKTERARAELLLAITDIAVSKGLSSAHILFLPDDEAHLARAAGWLIRENVQFHWVNPGYGSFEDYLADLSQPKRKKIRAERRKVGEAGVQTQLLEGEEITPADLEFFYQCYATTYHEHHSTPYLSLQFFEHLRNTMPRHLLLCRATRQGRPIACSLLMHADRILYGRYWGAIERVDCLHFEVAYYAPIQWAIARRITRFEGGAQGEHKLARGFSPVKTYSAHWLGEPAFYEAVARYLERETKGMEMYVNELEARDPRRR